MVNLNPNCSEAVFRIDVSKYEWDVEAQRAFDKAVIGAMEKEDIEYCIGEGDMTETKEVQMHKQNIFGKKVLVLSGSMPYAHDDILNNAVKKVNEKLDRNYESEVTET